MPTLSRLQVWNFRNLQHLDLSLAPGVSLLCGPNGQGKSNILEAVCYLGLLRSFRGVGVAQLKRWGSEGFTLRAEVADADAARRVTLAVAQDARRYLQVNQQPIERASEFIHRILCVPLVPEDLALVKGPASGRRRFLDIAISQAEPGYLGALQRYRAAVMSRNALLQQRHGGNPRVLAAYEDVLITDGAWVEGARRRFVSGFQHEVLALSPRLLGGEHTGFEVTYSCPGLPRDVNGEDSAALSTGLRESLERQRERDGREGRTSVGPHRADLAVGLAGRAVADYGSEGEARLASLCLRLATLELLRTGTSARVPTLALVDDVFGELDGRRRQAFFEVVGRTPQVLVTATAVPVEVQDRLAAHYRVEAGIVRQA